MSSTSRVLRTALSGLGRIGWQFHLPELQRHAGFRTVAVVDPLAERRAEATGLCGAAGYDAFERMLAAERPDLVVVASPTPFHREQILQAFAAGADVFCDKPLAPDLDQADELIAAARQHGRRLMVYQPHRAKPLAAAVRAILDSRKLGPLYLLKAGWYNYDRRNDWQAFRRNGGGMLNNYGAHLVDVCLHLAGGPAARVHASLRCIATLGDADDVAKLAIETSGGTLLDLEINMACALPQPTWVLCGAHGTASLDADGKRFLLRYHDPQAGAAGTLQDGLAARDRRYGGSNETLAWREETVALDAFPGVDFYDRVHRHFALGEAPFVPLEETREVMRVLDAARRSAASTQER